MRSTERFTGMATNYVQARPTYPQELVHWYLEQAPAPGLIVDLGCDILQPLGVLHQLGNFEGNADAQVPQLVELFPVARKSEAPKPSP